ncbi:MAG: 5'-nucleotidase C-terminal domain-containing protein [Deltaproteobacteria bacterium]|jgi:5'-nucleotidase|nr:5'-nucleotidase C-terminal domain-containing protein [Deltaproteobacteria bacterium]
MFEDVPSGAPGETLLVVTSDIHGRLAEDPARGRLGAAKLSGLLKRLRGEAGQVHLADCGDMFSGHAFASFDNGRTVAKALGRLGFEALTLGNHDFDFGLEEGDPLYHLNTLVPILTEAAGGRSPAVLGLSMGLRGGGALPGVVTKAFSLGELPGGGRLLAVGVPNPHTARRSLRECLAGIDFGLESTLEETRRKVLGNLAKEAAKIKGNDVLVVLSHLGHEGGAEGSVAGPELTTAPGVSAVVDGHGHLPYELRLPDRAAYLNCGEGLEAIAIIRLSKGKSCSSKLWRYEQLAGEAPDPEIEALVSDLSEKMGLGEKVAELPMAFGGGSERDLGLPPAGPLVCRALLAASKADLVLLNEGAVREGLSGVVTFGDVLECLPFRDSLFQCLMEGSEIASLAAWLAEGGSFPLGAGFSVLAYGNNAGGYGVEAVLGEDGAPLKPNRRYKLAASGQMMRRLGPFNPLARHECRNLGLVERVFSDGLKKLTKSQLEAAANASLTAPLVWLG